MNIGSKIRQAQPSKPETSEDKITLQDVVWAAVVWFVQNVLVLLGRMRQVNNNEPSKKPKVKKRLANRIHGCFQFVSRPIIMIGLLVGIVLVSLVIWLIFSRGKKNGR